MAKKKKRKYTKPPTTTTPKQKKAVDNLLSGEFKSKSAALRHAGYADATARATGSFLKQDGVQKYLKQLDKKAKEVLNTTVDDKIATIYIEGLDAKKRTRDGDDVTDHKMRREFAKDILEMKGIKKPDESGQITNNYTFFSVSQEQQENFSRNFMEFMRDKRQKALQGSDR